MDLRKNIKDVNDNVSKNVKVFLPGQFRYILGVYFLGLFFMLLFRVANFAIHSFISFSDVNIVLLIKSLVIGMWFDTAVLCRILSVFLVFIIIGTVFNIKKGWYYRSVHIVLCFVMALILFFVASDIAYFSYFNSHLNIISISWIQTPGDIAKIILRHPIYLLYLSAFLFSLVWFLWLMYCLYNAAMVNVGRETINGKRILKNICLSCLIVAVWLLGMYAKLPGFGALKVSDAYFSNSDFFNQLGVNPVFNFMKSVEEENFSKTPPLQVVGGITAKTTVEDEFLLRNEKPANNPKIPVASNIVLVLVEDMLSSDLTERNMGYLYGIKRKSVDFSSVYPDGSNYYNGLFASLFAYPSILSANMMNTTVIPKMQGISSWLKKHRYNNIFISYDTKKNNPLSAFLYRNDFDIVRSIDADNVQQQMNILSSQPFSFFCCVYMNADAGHNTAKQRDEKIRKFLTAARNTQWFKKTLFVIAGCNGEDKIPLMMYMPDVLKYSDNSAVASQTDIFPTVMSMIDEDYQNENIFGLNIFSAQRTYTVSSYSDKLIVRDNDWKYIWKDTGKEELYYKDTLYDIHSQLDKAEEMKIYGFSMLQMAQYRLSHAKTADR